MKSLCLLLLMVGSLMSFGQNLNEVKKKIGSLEDQFGNQFDQKKLNDEYFVIFVPLTDQPFRVYDLMKGSKFISNAFVVGSFFSQGGHGQAMPIGHLKDGFTKKYGKDMFSIWLDPENKVSKELKVNGHSIIQIKKNKIVKSTDFGNKLDDFMKEVEKLKQK